MDRNQEFLTVRIVSPKKELYTGLALSISSENSVGKFDILPEHANFVTLVDNKELIIVDQNKKKLKFQFPLAIIQSNSNRVNIYTDIFDQP